MEEIGLIKDFAIIMVVAGAVTLLFRRLRQPPILGYLIAGFLIGPFTLPIPPVTDVHTIRLLADLGLVLLLFGLGLEFSWNKIREIGLPVLLIGVVEILTMICLGYGLGRLLGWSTTDALFLGAAMHISSTVIIMKILRDLGKLNRVSSKLIMGILVVEDFAAVIIIAVLSGVATTGTANFGDIGSLLLRLVIFVVASLVFGALLIPRIMRFTHQFRSREALLITSLGLCFAMALLSKYLGLSVAAGAFLMGALIGDTQHSEEVTEVITPIRDMFAALFFIAIGMLIDISQFRSFIVPSLIVSGVFVVGKILINTMATFTSGYESKTALQVGMGKAQMGEFSLAIAKVGIDSGVVVAPLYPIIATATALTSLAAPYIIRSSDSVVDFLGRRAPRLLKEYVVNLSDWLKAVRMTFARQSEAARRIQRTMRAILINLVIMVVVIGIGTFAVHFVEGLAGRISLREDVIGMLLGFLTLVFCLPPLIRLWGNIRSLADEVPRYLLSRRARAGRWGHEALHNVLRDSIVVILSILVALWFIPFMVRLFFIGSFALAIPVLLLAILIYVLFRSLRRVHNQLEQTFRRVFLGEKE